MKLKTLFLVRPEAIKLARAEIQRGLPVKKAEPIMGAMSMASGAEAEAQLLELVNDATLQPDVRVHSIFHLGSVEAPSDTVVPWQAQVLDERSFEAASARRKNSDDCASSAT